MTYTFIQECPGTINTPFSTSDSDDNDDFPISYAPPTYSIIDPPFLIVTFEPLHPLKSTVLATLHPCKSFGTIASAQTWRLRLAAGTMPINSAAFRPVDRCYAPTDALTDAQYLAALDIDEAQSEREVAGREIGLDGKTLGESVGQTGESGG